jgi:hypothetical protein
MSVSREVLPTENRRKCSRSFASKSAQHRPENELAFSSVRTRAVGLEFRCREIPSDRLKSLGPCS